MKSIYLQTVVLICLLASCQKNNGKSSNNGNGNGNGGRSDSLSFTGYSPLYPYTTDEVTLNGTGFNPDKTKDTVLVVYPGGGMGKMATINSATATQLKIVVPPDSVLFQDQLLFPTYYFQILANGKQINLPLDKTPIFKPTLHLRGMRGGEYDVAGRPGDTILISGVGFTPSGNSLSIGGKTLNIYKVDTAAGEFMNNAYRYNVANSTICYAYSVIPKDFFGGVNDEAATKDQTISFTNGDGKNSQIQAKLGVSPIMLITSITPGGATFTPGYGYSYSLSGLTGSGGSVRVQIVGKFLKNDMDVELTGTLTYTNTVVSDVHASPSVSGFPDSTVIEYSGSGLKAGLTYQIRIWANNMGQGNIFYGSQTFFMKQ